MEYWIFSDDGQTSRHFIVLAGKCGQLRCAGPSFSVYSYVGGLLHNASSSELFVNCRTLLVAETCMSVVVRTRQT